MADRLNKRRVISTLGKMILDGVTVADGMKFTVTATPEVAESRALGEKVKSKRYTGMEYKVSVTQYKTTPWYKKAIQPFMDSGETPEFTLQGVQMDGNSDYYDVNKEKTVTCKGCVLTGDINLIELDSEGEYVQDELEFSAYQVNF